MYEEKGRKSMCRIVMRVYKKRAAIPAAAMSPLTAVGIAATFVEDAVLPVAAEAALEASDEALDRIEEMEEPAAPVIEETLDDAVLSAPFPEIVVEPVVVVIVEPSVVSTETRAEVVIAESVPVVVPVPDEPPDTAL